jgi:ABC-type nickel/cobalt efflux system permease component RcnA
VGWYPVPSALIVLLGAVALGRTWFGVLLVVAYGAGMAATLTAAGLVLVQLRNHAATILSQRVGRWSGRLAAATPILTAVLVLVVGLGMALRGVLPLLVTGG